MVKIYHGWVNAHRGSEIYVNTQLVATDWALTPQPASAYREYADKGEEIVVYDENGEIVDRMEV